MSFSKSGTSSLAGSLAAALLACLSLAGCNALYSSSSVPHSMFTSGQVPVVYAVTSDGSIASASIDHSKEGVILSASLNEAVLPQVWAKVDADDKLFHADASVLAGTVLVTDGSASYAKFVKIGTGTAAKVLTASVSGSTVTYAGGGVTLPDANLASDSQKWYYDAVTAGQVAVVDDADGTTILLSTDPDYAVPTVLESSLDATWTTGRIAAVAFLLAPGRVLNGTSALTPVVSGTTWKLGPDDTAIPAAWAFDQYWPLLTKAFEATASTTDGNSSATSE